MAVSSMSRLVRGIWVLALTLTLTLTLSLSPAHSLSLSSRQKQTLRAKGKSDKPFRATESNLDIEPTPQGALSVVATGAQAGAHSLFPCGDELDKRILRIALPAILNFALIPLVGAVDTFWVGRMKNALCLAGQGAANQVFSSAFWIISFLPNIITPLVAKAAGAGDTEAVQDAVGEAMTVALIMGTIGCAAIYTFPEMALNIVLQADAPAREFARPYLNIRALTFIPSILSTVAFAAFRGTQDVTTPLKISVLSNILNVLLDPVFMFRWGFGVSGAAAATCVAELTSVLLYMRELVKRKIVNPARILKFPTVRMDLLVGAFSIQLRAIALQVVFIAVQRTTQALDKTGTAAAAHAITVQLWQLGGVILLAMSTVASILVPTAVAKSKKEGTSLLEAKQTADRLLVWGGGLGVVLGTAQLAMLPLLGVFSPLPEVQKAARLPSIIGAVLQLINGVVFVGEGVQTGNQCFLSLAATTGIASGAMLLTLRFYGNSLAGVWGGFAVFNTIRLLGVLSHHFVTGPLTNRKVKESEKKLIMT